MDRDDSPAVDGTVPLAPITFTEAEAIAVVAALAVTPAGPTRAVDGVGDTGPTLSARRSALEKLLDAMSLQARSRAADLAERTRPVGAGPAEPGPRSPAVPPIPAPAEVEEALHRRVVVMIDYTDAAGQASWARPVEPHLLACARGVWYLVGWCRWRDAPRWFRCDRVTAAELTDRPVSDREEFATFDGLPPDAVLVR